MAEADVIVCQAFADLAALSITRHGASAEAQRLNEQLSAALTRRVVIEHAKGVISERAGVDLTEAFARLRRYARNHNLVLPMSPRPQSTAALTPAHGSGYLARCHTDHQRGRRSRQRCGLGSGVGLPEVRQPSFTTEHRRPTPADPADGQACCDEAE